MAISAATISMTTVGSQGCEDARPCPGGMRTPRRETVRTCSPAGIPSSDVNRVNVASIAASFGSAPVSLASMRSSACCSRALMLITATSITVP